MQHSKYDLRLPAFIAVEFQAQGLERLGAGRFSRAGRTITRYSVAQIDILEECRQLYLDTIRGRSEIGQFNGYTVWRTASGNILHRALTAGTAKMNPETVCRRRYASAQKLIA